MANRPVLMSPLEFTSRELRDEGYCPRPDATLVWVAMPDFGAYALALREHSNLSLRKAADGMRISHPFLAKIERGQVVRPESLELLDRMSTTYGVRLSEVMERAGVRYAVDDPTDAPVRNSLRDQLRRLLSHDHFRPDDFADSELAHISDRMAEILLVVAQKAWNRGAGRSTPVLFDVLDGTAEPDE